tara:strand:- start:224 stop:481 length:258 start_codon:yes stop_codon:yes gene_type:complete
MNNYPVSCPGWVQILAAISIVNFVASFVYMVLTRNIGTPFKDSLTEEQLKIKYESSTSRGRIYSIGVFIGLIIVFAIWVKWYRGN